MTTINNLTIEQMREAFERHQADLTGTDYKELKAHFDNNEQYFSSRYNEGSLYERDWLVWEACWQSRQAELDQLNKVLDERTKEWLEAIKLGTYFQEAAKPLKDEVDQLNKTLSIKTKFLEDSDVANKFLSEKLEEKNKRIRSAVTLLNEIHKRSLDNPEVWDLVDDVWEALRGKDQYTEHRSKAEQQTNKGARLTKHQIDFGDKNANS